MLQPHFVRTYCNPLYLRKQSLFHWLNMVFNRVDTDRLKEVGPDRACAEWLLRNGAFVKWSNSQDYLTDYNKLPCDDVRVFIEEIDATESSIMHYGFDHFKGCNYIKKIKFQKCYYLENQALQSLSILTNSLQSLKIIECLNISDKGLIYLTALTNLRELVLADLPYVKNKEKTLSHLKSDLPRCNIQFL